MLLVTACGGAGDDGPGAETDSRPSSPAAQDADRAGPLSKQGIRQALPRKSDFGRDWDVGPVEAEKEYLDDGVKTPPADPDCRRVFRKAEALVFGGTPGGPVVQATRDAADVTETTEGWTVRITAQGHRGGGAEKIVDLVTEAAAACEGETVDTLRGPSTVTKITVPGRGDGTAGLRTRAEDGTGFVDLVAVREGDNVSFFSLYAFSLHTDVLVAPDDELTAKFFDTAAERLHDAVVAEQN